MESTIAIERSIWIAAPCERVWQAITDPDQIAKWFSPGMQWRSTGQQVGGRLSVIDPATDTVLVTQVIEVADPPHKLVTRQEVQPGDPAHVTTWTLAAENGGTRLTLIYSGFEQEPEDVRQQNMDQHGVGFGMMLENVKAQVEGTPLPYPQGF